MVIGQAFSAAYKHFLRSSGVSDQQLEQAEYAHILNAQSIPQLEVESLGDRTKIKKVRKCSCVLELSIRKQSSVESLNCTA